MIYEGTEPKEYVPYGYIKETMRGKNEINSTTAQKKILNINLSADKQYLKLNGTSNANGHVRFNAWNFKKGTYTASIRLVSGKITSTSLGTLFYISSKDQADILGRLEFFLGAEKKVAFTLTENTEIQFRLWARTAETFENAVIEYMIEEGNTTDTSTTYEPYKEPKEQLIYIGDNELLTDDFVVVDEKGNTKLGKEWGKVVLDGNENWLSASSVVEGASRFYFDLPDVYVSSKHDDTNIYVCSNFFNAISWIAIYNSDKTTKNAVSNYNTSSTTVQGRIVVRIDNSIANSVESFKTWLSENKPVVYYKLKTPQETDLGKHDKIIPLEGTNNIDVEATLEPSKIETTYYVDKR